MLHLFNINDTKVYKKIITEADIAAFESGTVHEVYSTFSLARDAEWCGRLFVLEIIEPHEQGIGKHIAVNHVSPAFIGQEVLIISTLVEVSSKNEVHTHFEAFVGERKIAFGTQVQKILPLAIIADMFKKLKEA
jgi:fluoroacetyl-CoA thioesterase